MVHIERACPQLFVADVIDTAEYYRDVLGFSFERFFGNPPVFVIVNRDGARLLFKNAPPEKRPLPSNMSAPGGFTDVYLYCDDVDALATEFRAKGAEITREPTLQREYNGRELHVRDCNGRTLCFGQLLD
ncbi:MAG TPA: VOC family protein [Caulobacteraceae bacterium]|jgi:predicted enzyme related to lactoylglutathione lyase|nr:VOC family protein [Caulobacteraceae bacterium]